MCLLSGILCFGLGATTQVATKVGNGVYEMSTWADEGAETDTLTSVDITGDGKTDKIETVTTSDEIELKVNDKIVRMYLTGSINIQVVQLSKKAFFEITTYEKGDKINCGLYEMKNNKLKRVLDYKKLVNLKQYVKNNFITSNGCWGGFQATSVKGNTIYLRGWFGIQESWPDKCLQTSAFLFRKEIHTEINSSFCKCRYHSFRQRKLYKNLYRNSENPDLQICWFFQKSICY